VSQSLGSSISFTRFCAVESMKKEARIPMEITELDMAIEAGNSQSRQIFHKFCVYPHECLRSRRFW
jgi:hypothetical protein